MAALQAKEDVDKLYQLTLDRSNLAFGSALVGSSLTTNTSVTQ